MAILADISACNYPIFGVREGVGAKRALFGKETFDFGRHSYREEKFAVVMVSESGLSCDFVMRRCANLLYNLANTGGQPMKTNLLDRITIEPGKCGGRPCIRRMRIRVNDILACLQFAARRSDIVRLAVQLPPLLAAWLSSQFNVEAFSLRT